MTKTHPTFPKFTEGMAILAFFVLVFLGMPWIIQWGFVYLDWVGGFF